jgi:hypothetical protein
MVLQDKNELFYYWKKVELILYYFPVIQYYFSKLQIQIRRQILSKLFTINNVDELGSLKNLSMTNRAEYFYTDFFVNLYFSKNAFTMCAVILTEEIL